ncbi:MAG: serine/threonine protein kinase [Anaerolineae bacterium]|nr:serine/threonine protein kinase [Anaerolineae bacterium]
MQQEKRVGKYILIHQIARSGQALLFLSQSPSTHKPIAVKLYPKKLADADGFMRQFFAELSHVQQLTHPNILPIHHYELADKFPAIEMPYMAGGNLEMRIQNEINLVTLKDSVGQIFQALIHAQRQGSIHGNIKPTNILFDDEGNAYLSDFRLKSVAQYHPVANTTIYASPEHVHGEKLDDRSDVFSFGMVLFSWMTGEYPLSSPLNDSESTYEPPSLIHYLPDISLAMNDVIVKATQYQPSDRYGSIKEFAEAFFRALRTDKIFLQMLEDVRSDITEFASKTILNAHSRRVMGFEEALSRSILTDDGYYIRAKDEVQPKRRSKSYDMFLAVSGTLVMAFVGFLVFVFIASLLANNPAPPYEPAFNPPGYVVHSGRDVEISAPSAWKPVQRTAGDILAGFFEGASVD